MVCECVCLFVSFLHFRFSFSSRRELFRLRRCIPSGCARTLVTLVVFEINVFWFWCECALLGSVYRDIPSVRCVLLSVGKFIPISTVNPRGSSAYICIVMLLEH